MLPACAAQTQLYSNSNLTYTETVAKLNAAGSIPLSRAD
jgi:hypothetical protein